MFTSPFKHVLNVLIFGMMLARATLNVDVDSDAHQQAALIGMKLWHVQVADW